MAGLAKSEAKARRDFFLKEFAKHGNLALAATTVGVDITTPYSWLQRNPDFAREYRAIEVALGEELHGLVLNRARYGTPKGVYFEGQKVGEEREYDSRREQMVLRALLPEKYGAKLEVDLKSIPKANIIAELAKLEDEARIVDAEATVSDVVEDPPPIGHGTPPRAHGTPPPQDFGGI